MRVQGRLFAVVLFGLLASCASNPERRGEIVTNSANTIQPTQEKLSSFSSFELAPLKMAEAIKSDDDKREYAKQLETKLSSKFGSLFNEWQQSSKASDRSLIIEPELLALRIVGGGARFWAGAFAGDSDIQLKLTIKDTTTNNILGTPVISKAANAFAGGWSIGASDKNLVDYIVDISEQYLKNNYE